MLAYLWPVALVILSNVIYQICAKALPSGMDPLASMTITYLVGAVVSATLYFALHRDADLLHEYAKLNWAPFLLGIVVGLDVGMLFAYRNGWQVSMLNIVQSAFVAAALILVGRLLYHEALNWNKIAGIAVCLIGLVLINLK
ncbi:EamA family transporter [Lachnoclostridium sp. Marseille-P6806]|uniref:EamA family transporter n=1 Tax=Lachnoclostridium sp. Marseille-P6806 TaxID=2364793 RepID=UPI0010321153|nr:EamA family transporter [Lachnoclostridium sp. Marseille-P6806]